MASNYRPLSLQCSIGKVAEKVLLDQLDQYLRRHNLTSTTQHAYQRARSCQTALTELDSFISHERNDGKDVAHVGTDQSGAYNCADHDIFLGKLELLGLGSLALKIFRSYLTGRKTRAKIGNFISEPISLTAGFPEGSCLSCFNWLINIIDANVVSKLVEMDLNGPERCLHFIGLDRTSTARSLLPPIYNTNTVMSKTSVVNLQPMIYKTLAIEYSDDISCAISAKGDRVLQAGVDKIMERFTHFFSVNGLALNQNKSSLICFRYGAGSCTLKVNGIPEKKVLKFLGVFFDSDYTFQKHYNSVKKTINWKVSKLNPVCRYLTQKTRQEVLSALCYGSLLYCFQIWGRLPGIRNQAQKTQNVINRAIVQKKMSRSNMLKSLSYLKIENWYKYLLVIDLWKYLRTSPCPYTLSLLDWRTRLYFTRRQTMQLNYKHKVLHGSLSFIFAAVSVWNQINIPEVVKEVKSKSLDDLKLKVKGILTDLYDNYNIPP